MHFCLGLVNKADLQWQPGGLEASDRAAAWWGWQTDLLSGPPHPAQPSLTRKFKYAPSHKCIMGTHIPLLSTYQALTLWLYGPLNIQVTVGIQWVPAAFNLWEPDLVFCIFTVLFLKTFTQKPLLYIVKTANGQTRLMLHPLRLMVMIF